MSGTDQILSPAEFSDFDHRMMGRALELARLGRGQVSPNPMVGAVVALPSGEIIGEGWHRRFGEGHAEVNALAAVKDERKSHLPSATIYVTLEPCSHYGKTPPCAQLLINSGIGRVVVGAGDPNPKVSGRGIEMLKAAGIKVECGLLARESEQLNVKFMTAHRLKRPFVTLKWARSADGFMDMERRPDEPPAKISTPETLTLVHRLRAHHDAVMVGSGTFLADTPRLDCRLWPGRNPLPVIADRRGRISADMCGAMAVSPLIVATSDIETLLGELYARGITSLLVEGGAQLLAAFIKTGIWDVAREEISGDNFGKKGRVAAPVIEMTPFHSFVWGPNTVNLYRQNLLAEVKNL